MARTFFAIYKQNVVYGARSSLRIHLTDAYTDDLT